MRGLLGLALLGGAGYLLYAALKGHGAPAQAPAEVTAVFLAALKTQEPARIRETARVMRRDGWLTHASALEGLAKIIEGRQMAGTA